MGTNLFDVLRCRRDVAALASGAVLDKDQVASFENDLLDGLGSINMKLTASFDYYRGGLLMARYIAADH